MKRIWMCVLCGLLSVESGAVMAGVTNVTDVDARDAGDAVSDVHQFLGRQLRLEERLHENAATSPVQNLTPPPVSGADRDFIEQMKTLRNPVLSQAKKPVPEALYFVSFSVPTAGLKRMVAEADRFHIPATIRGMVGETMMQTTRAVRELVEESNRGGVEINPPAFQTWGITSVPVLIVTCGNGQHDRISGNIRLQEALERIAKDGDCPEVAQKLLDGAKS